jgi:signal transduction histidine kinase
VLDESLRLLATPVPARGKSFLVVVCTSLDERNEALANLTRVEIVGLAGALLACCVVGYHVAGLALRPVEALRSRAAEITPEGLAPESRLLPVSAVDDELGRLGRTLNEMLGRIQRAQTAERTALQRQQRLVADASHQLRTPLTVLKSEVEVALLGPADTVTLRRALESAGEEADRLTQLTDHLLQAAADDSTLVVERKPLSVRELAQTVADRHRSRASAAGRDITVTVRSDLVVSADQIRLEQALANLVDNALLHGAGPIELAGWRDATGTHLAVSDAGPGFGERAGASIFARFQRGNSLRRGNGLGLAIVHAIAAAHDGTVAVDSDDGARVTITLPD